MSENSMLYFQPWLCGQSSAASSRPADQSEDVKMLGAVLISHTSSALERRRERCVKMADYSVATRISLEELILRLYDIDAVKFGEFTLKSGIESPIYIDLRVIVSYPDILVRVAEYLWDAAKQGGGKFVSVCGVPYTALPLATCISTSQNLPMLVRRKEAKDYGTKKIVEGHYKAGDICLVVEDVVTSGSSVLETVESLKNEGLVVRDCVVLLDREQGGRSKLEMQGIKLHSVLTVNQILDVLETAEKVDSETVAKVKKFVADNRFDIMAASHAAAAAAAAAAANANTASAANGNKRKMEESAIANGSSMEKQARLNKAEVMRYRDRAQLCSHPMSKALFLLMEEKKSNLAFSVDVTECNKALELVDKVGPHICLVKTHVDILADYTPGFTKELQKLAEKHKFLIFEDRKFADIGNTVKHQFSGGLYKISSWADLVNAHSVSGDGIIKGLKEACNEKNKGCILIAEMSSSGNLATGEYTEATVRMAEENDDFVVGFICQKRLTDNPEFIHMTPGIQLNAGSGDGLGQQYLTPEQVIKENQSDVIIVGRGILQAEDPAATAQQYKEAGYGAYRSLFT